MVVASVVLAIWNPLTVIKLAEEERILKTKRGAPCIQEILQTGELGYPTSKATTLKVAVVKYIQQLKNNGFTSSPIIPRKTQDAPPNADPTNSIINPKNLVELQFVDPPSKIGGWEMLTPPTEQINTPATIIQFIASKPRIQTRATAKAGTRFPKAIASPAGSSSNPRNNAHVCNAPSAAASTK